MKPEQKQTKATYSKYMYHCHSCSSIAWFAKLLFRCAFTCVISQAWLCLCDYSSMVIWPLFSVDNMIAVSDIDPIRRYLPAAERPRMSERYSSFQVTRLYHHVPTNGLRSRTNIAKICSMHFLFQFELPFDWFLLLNVAVF